MALDDLITTIDSDAEDVQVEAAPKQLRASKANGAAKRKGAKAAVVDEGPADDKDALNPDFLFDLTGDTYDDVLRGQIGLADLVKGSKNVRVFSIACNDAN